MTQSPVKRVVILGGGTAGWLAAAMLAKTWGRSLELVLVESEEIGTVGVGEATIPSIRTFNDLLGSDEYEFHRQTRGTYKLGIEFAGWGQVGERYFHPFGAHGRDTPDFKFLQLWLRLKHAAMAGECPDPGPISQYCLSAVAAKSGRFQRPSSNPNDILGTLRYAYHFDASLYARFLRVQSEQRGVERIEGRITQVGLRAESGFIESVGLSDGRVVEGDLFVDCSGFKGLLIDGALKAGFESWAKYLPCDRAIAIPCEATSDPVPFTTSTADEAGWRWRIPLQHRVGNGYVYCSAFLSETQAAERLVSRLDGKPLAEPRPLSFEAGRRHRFWIKNCVALGLAGGFIEPLESTSIHLIQTGISKLIVFFPDRNFDQADIDEFNRSTIREYEAVRDFIVLHYYATRRDDAPFWKERQAMDIPESLMRRIELFRSKGRIFRFQDELFAEDSWLAVMLGQGLRPRGYDPLVNKLPVSDISRNVAQLGDAIARAGAGLSSHKDYIMRHCSSPGATGPV